MVNITPYRSNNYPTPEHAQRVADRLSVIDGNEYTVYTEMINGESSFHFDNSESLKFSSMTTITAPAPLPDPHSSTIFTVADMIEFIATDRQPILDYISARERLQ